MKNFIDDPRAILDSSEPLIATSVEEAGDTMNQPQPSIDPSLDFFDYAGVQRSFNVRLHANDIWIGNYPKALEFYATEGYYPDVEYVQPPKLYEIR